jgi:hypothetical protein
VKSGGVSFSDRRQGGSEGMQGEPCPKDSMGLGVSYFLEAILVIR